MSTDTVTGFETTIWNRPARVEEVYQDTAKVMFLDTNWTFDWVPLEALEGGDE
jgi:hypothetical protein